MKKLLFAVVFAGAAMFASCGGSHEEANTANADSLAAAATADDDDGSCTFERDALLGSYSVSGSIACGVTGNGTVSGQSLTITESTASTAKVIIAFSGISLTCTVSGSSFTVDGQTIDGFDYSGNGNVNGNTINMTINEFDVSIPETCIFTLNGSRQ